MRRTVVQERRQRKRFGVRAKVLASWVAATGGPRSSQARCSDISQIGIRLETDQAIPPRTVVHLESAELHMAGAAVVRHCSPKGPRFEVGLEFAAGLEWRAPHT
jgi:hypothetical protein